MTGPRFDFTGKSVLVTGASRGIGHAVASAFAAAGADLTILADDAAVNEPRGACRIYAGDRFGVCNAMSPTVTRYAPQSDTLSELMS